MFALSTWFLLALAALFAIGFVALLRSVSKVASGLGFTYLYLVMFHVFVDQDDSQAYAWLTLNANRMQAQMGTQGLMTFKPPFANHMIYNYPVVLNVLPEVRKCLTDQLLSRNLGWQLLRLKTRLFGWPQAFGPYLLCLSGFWHLLESYLVHLPHES